MTHELVKVDGVAVGAAFGQVATRIREPILAGCQRGDASTFVEGWPPICGGLIGARCRTCEELHGEAPGVRHSKLEGAASRPGQEPLAIA
jgi:hypothetical protein